MKKSYFFISLFLCFNLNVLIAQSCPPTGFSDSTSLFFFYDAGTSLCVDRPTIVTVEGNDFTLVDCGDIYSVYDLVPGSPLVNPNVFVADFGYGTCEYTNGTLTDEQLLSIKSLSEAFKEISIYPNPLLNGDNLNIISSSPLDVNIKIHSVNGKLILSNQEDNLSNKTINVQDLSNGIYFISIESNNYSTTKKLVIMR